MMIRNLIIVFFILASCAPNPPRWVQSLETLPKIEGFIVAGFYSMFMGLVSSFFAIISGMIKFFEMGSISDIFYTNPGYHGLIQLSATIILFILFGTLDFIFLFYM